MPDKARVIRILLAVLAVMLLGGYLLNRPDAWDRPSIVMRTASYAIVFLPARADSPAATTSLVAAARPRLDLNPDATPFVGIRFVPLSWADLEDLHAGEPEGSAADTIFLLQELDVSAGCGIRLEHAGGGYLQIKVFSAEGQFQSGDSKGPVIHVGQPCRMHATLVGTDSSGYLVRAVDRTLSQGETALLQIQPAWPVRFRHIPVTALRFDTEDGAETGYERRSSLIQAAVSLPHYDRAETGEHGDLLRLGPLAGELVEVSVGDTIHTLYRGTASRLVIDEENRFPSLLNQLTKNEDVTLVVHVAFAVVTLLAAIL